MICLYIINDDNDNDMIEHIKNNRSRLSHTYIIKLLLLLINNQEGNRLKYCVQDKNEKKGGERQRIKERK